MSLTDLVDPVIIPSFTLKIDNSEWSFPGANVSSKVYEEGKGCHASGGEIMTGIKGNLLTLADQAALQFLAVEHLKGNDLSDVPKQAVQGAMQIFCNNLHMAITTSNPDRNIRQLFFGEWAYDAITTQGALKSSTDDFLGVKWIQRPKVTQLDENNFTYEEGDSSTVIQTQIPKWQGSAALTREGYLNPETGVPFVVDRTQKAEAPEFFLELGKQINSKANLGLPDENLIIMGRSYHSYIVDTIGKEIVSIEDLDLPGFIDLWKPSYGFSHAYHDEPLPLSDPMVVMRNLDERINLFTVSISADHNNCGIQARAAYKFS